MSDHEGTTPGALELVRPIQRIPLASPVPEHQASELASRIFFLSEEILDFSLVTSGGEIQAVDLSLRENAGADDLRRKLHTLVRSGVLTQPRPEPKVLWTASRSKTATDVYDELRSRDIAFEAGEGQVALSEPVLSLIEALDSCIRASVVQALDAREVRYPTLIPVGVMQRSGYLQSFPHFMMFVTRLRGDIDTYQGFERGIAKGQDVGHALHANCANFDYCLPPTMCFHTYSQYADCTIPRQSLVVTSRGKSFRHEARYHRSIERLWDFTIREVVFLGPRDFVLTGRRGAMDGTFRLMESLGLQGRCEVASDPFFAEPNAAGRAWSQRLLELKYELRLDIGAGRDVAVCSFNFHERHFGESFGITLPNGAEPVHTACVGFGLERLAYAFLCQHGLDPTRWPIAVREASGG